jgi:hypothetical protein
MQYPGPSPQQPKQPAPALDLADVTQLQQIFELDKYKEMRRILFYLMNGHDEASYYSKTTPSTDVNPKEVEEDEYLGGKIGPYITVLVPDYIAFLEAREDWYDKLHQQQPRTATITKILERVPPAYLSFLETKKKGWYSELCLKAKKGTPSTKEVFLVKALRLSDYSLAKGKIRGGISRTTLDQFKSDCLDFCDVYYALLDQFETLSDDEIKILPVELQEILPLCKERKLALVLCRFVHLLNTLSGQRDTVSAFLTGSEKQKMGTPTHLDRSPLWHATPRSRDSLNSFELNEGNVDAIKMFLQLFECQYLERAAFEYFSRTRIIINNSSANPRTNIVVVTPSFSSTFWSWGDNILTTIDTIILLLDTFDKDHTKIDQDAIDNLRDFRIKLEELKLYCQTTASKFTPIFKKLFYEYFLPEDVIRQRYKEQSARQASAQQSNSTPIKIPLPQPNQLRLAIPKTPPHSPPASPHTPPGAQPHLPSSLRTSFRKPPGPSLLRREASGAQLAAATSSAPDLRTLPDKPQPAATREPATVGSKPLLPSTVKPKNAQLPPTEVKPATQKNPAQTAAPLPAAAQSSHFFSNALSVLGGFIGRKSSDEKLPQADEQKDGKTPTTATKKGSKITSPSIP